MLASQASSMAKLYVIYHRDIIIYITNLSNQSLKCYTNILLLSRPKQIESVHGCRNTALAKENVSKYI